VVNGTINCIVHLRVQRTARRSLSRHARRTRPRARDWIIHFTGGATRAACGRMACVRCRDASPERLASCIPSVRFWRHSSLRTSPPHAPRFTPPADYTHRLTTGPPRTMTRSRQPARRRSTECPDVGGEEHRHAMRGRSQRIATPVSGARATTTRSVRLQVASDASSEVRPSFRPLPHPRCDPTSAARHGTEAALASRAADAAIASQPAQTRSGTVV
jgi:hypothetical protein